MRKITEPSNTHLVEEVLKIADDFLSLAQIVERTRLSQKEVAMALWHLRKCKAVWMEVEHEEEGTVSYWMATPWTDSRSKTVDERVKEGEGSRKLHKGRRREVLTKKTYPDWTREPDKKK